MNRLPVSKSPARPSFGRTLCLIAASAALTVGGLVALPGCKQPVVQETIGPIPTYSFARKWLASVDLKGDEVRGLNLRGDTLFLTTRDNQLYAFSAPGGKLLWGGPVIPPGAPIKPPMVLGDGRVVVPAIDSFHIFEKSGHKLPTLPSPYPVRGPGFAVGDIVYIGVDSATGGRLESLEMAPNSRINNHWQVFTGAGVTSAPTAYQNIIYAADESGRVWAINEEGAGIWSLPGVGSSLYQQPTFQTQGPIKADLKVDEAGLYVASGDTILYCLDRGSGKIKWKYVSGSPLDVAPVPTASGVYQFVPGVGLAAIDKGSKVLAQPRWTADHANQFLAEDEHFIYAHFDDGSFAALDKKSGHPAFRSQRKDLFTFAEDDNGGTIFAATRDGQVMAIQPTLKPGSVGVLVQDTTAKPTETLADAR